MLPILISRNADISVIIMVVLIKVVIGMIAGFTIDFFYRNKTKKDFKICEHDHCDCEESIFKSSIIHTLKIFVFILIITFVLNLGFHYISEDILKKVFFNNTIFASSVMITELYLSGVITLGTAIGGLLTGSGVALAVLFKSNENKKETLTILTLIYIIGVVSGIVLNLIGV